MPCSVRSAFVLDRSAKLSYIIAHLLPPRGALARRRRMRGAERSCGSLLRTRLSRWPRHSRRSGLARRRLRSSPQRRVRAVRGPSAAGPPKQTVRADASAHRISPHPSRAGAILSSPSILHSPPGFTARRTQRRACRAPSLFQTAPRHSGAPQASPEPITPSVSEQGAAAIDAFSPAPSAAMGSGLSRCSPRNDGEWHSQ